MKNYKWIINEKRKIVENSELYNALESHKIMKLLSK